MKRRLLNLLTALSLMLCVAVVVLWVRSYSTGESVAHVGRCHNAVVNSLTGQIGYELWRGEGAGEFDLIEAEWSSASDSGVFRSDESDTPAAYDRRLSPWRYARPGRPPLMTPTGWDVTLGIDIGSAPAATSPYGLPYWSGSIYWITLPYWLILAVVSIPAIWRGQKLARHRFNRRAGCCPSCAYDLTANVSGVCPECGQQTVGYNPETS